MIGYGIDYGIITGIIISLSELIKQTKISRKLIPIINIIMGIILCLIFTDSGWKDVLLNGLLTGLTASGLYSSVKNSAQLFEGGE